MNTVKSFCQTNFENVESNIFKIIENDLNDGLILSKVTDDCGREFYLLLEKELFDIFKSVDYIYEVKEANNIDIKMIMIKEEKQYFESNKVFINKIISTLSLILLHDDDQRFKTYLTDYANEYSDLIKYSEIIKNGWIKPKFDCTIILLNAFKNLK